MPRYAGVNAPGPGSLVDLQHPLGRGCIGCWWPNAAPDAGRGLWIPDLSGYGMTLTYSAGTALPWYPGEHAGEWCLYGAGAGYWYTADAPHFNALAETHSLTMMFTGSIDVSTTNFQGLFVSNSGWWAGGGLWSQRDGEGNRWLRMSRHNYHATWSTPETFSDWYHLVGVYDNHTEYLYNEGVQVATIYCPYHVGTFPGIRICNEAVYGGNLLGRWSSASIWNRAFSPEEVAWLYREPAAMIWEPGGTKTFLLGGAPAPLTVTHTATLYAAESYTATRGLGLSAAEREDLTRAMQLVGQEVEALARSLGLSAAETDSLTRAMTLRGLEALEATRTASLQAQEVAAALHAVQVYAQQVQDLSRAVALHAAEAETVLRDLGAVGAEGLSVARALGLYATGGSDAEELLATWLATTFGAEQTSLTRGITLWAKEAAVGVRDVLRIADERGTLRLKDLRDDLRIDDERDTLRLE